MKPNKISLNVGVLVALIVLGCGCATLKSFEEKNLAKAQQGKFVNGVMSKEIKSSVLAIFQVAMEILKKQGQEIIKEEHGFHSAAILSVFPTKEKVIVNIESSNEFNSLIKIKIGDYGDEARSQEILTAIINNL